MRECVNRMARHGRIVGQLDAIGMRIYRDLVADGHPRGEAARLAIEDQNLRVQRARRNAERDESVIWVGFGRRIRSARRAGR